MKKQIGIVAKVTYATLAVLTIVSSGFSDIAHAERSRQYEIEPTTQDKVAKLDYQISHVEYRTQEMPCEAAGETIAVMYKSTYGWSSSTTLVGTCRLEYRHTQKACAGDNSIAAQKCYNEAIDQYGLQGIHKKIKVQLYDEEGQSPFPQSQTSPGSGLNLNRTSR